MVGKSTKFDRDAWQSGWRLWLATFAAVAICTLIGVFYGLERTYVVVFAAVGAIFAMVWPRITRWWRKPKAFGQMKVLVNELSDAFDPNKMD